MSTSPDLGVPLVSQQQAQPEITHNEAIIMMTAGLKGALQVGLNTPPVSPIAGDLYVIGNAPTGAWAGRADCITVYIDGGWRFLPDRNSAGTIITMGARQAGLRVWDNQTNTLFVWTGVTWQQTNVQANAGQSGWADYQDTQYTSGSPFALAANTDTTMPNNGLGGNQANAPFGVTFYDPNTQRLLGIENHGRLVTISFTVVPTAPGTTSMDFWFDINGLQLYRHTTTFPSGQGVPRTITVSVGVYHLTDWATFGALQKVRANGTANIYNIRYVFHQLHPV